VEGVKVSDNCVEFIRSCLEKDVEKRPTMKALKRHSWLNVQ
jgi:serine/threonine protein kinase